MTVTRSARRYPLAALVSILFFCGIPLSRAAVINVTTTADALANDAHCSLREAIINMNNGSTTWSDCTPSSGPYGTSDTVNLPAGTYTITLAGAGDDAALTGDYDISRGVTIAGAGSASTIVDANQLDRVFHVTGSIAVSFSGLTITNGSAVDCPPAPGLGSCGGGILDTNGTVSLSNATISNSATTHPGADGGGIFTSGGTVNVTDSTISGNSTYYGGAISGGNTINIVRSTLSGNSAGYYGGAVYANGSTTIANSTLTGNSAGSSGGAVINLGATVTIIHATISGNSGGGAAVHGYAGTTILSNSIVAGQAGSTTDCAGSITSNGHNLEGATTCGFTGTGDHQNASPLLSALASNGGPTETMAIAANSPAIDAADAAVSAAAPISSLDQRGMTRPHGNGSDIGAFEYGATLAAVATVPALSGWRLVLLAAMLGLCGLLSAVVVPRA